MAVLETLATIFVVLLLLKLFFIFIINPKSWVKVTERILHGGSVVILIYIVLAVLTGYYLFQSITIIQFAAVALFISLLMGLGFLPYSKELMPLVRKMLKKSKNKIFRENWFNIVIWLGLTVWILYELLM